MKRMFLNYIAVCSDIRFFDKFIIFKGAGSMKNFESNVQYIKYLVNKEVASRFSAAHW